jgi:hypothetical protein
LSFSSYQILGWECEIHLKQSTGWSLLNFYVARNTYVNHWERRSLMVSVEDVSLKGGGSVLKQQIWNAARDTIQQWTGQRLAECSLYGIRIYEEGTNGMSGQDAFQLDQANPHAILSF